MDKNDQDYTEDAKDEKEESTTVAVEKKSRTLKVSTRVASGPTSAGPSSSATASASSSRKSSQLLKTALTSPVVVNVDARNVIRQRVRENMKKIFENGLKKYTEYADTMDASALAQQVEQSMFQHFAEEQPDPTTTSSAVAYYCGDAYKEKFRILYANLRDDTNLKAVLSGRTDPEHLVQMNAEDLANEQLKSIKQAVMDEKIRHTVLTEEQAAVILKKTKPVGAIANAKNAAATQELATTTTSSVMTSSPTTVVVTMGENGSAAAASSSSSTSSPDSKQSASFMDWDSSATMTKHEEKDAHATTTTTTTTTTATGSIVAVAAAADNADNDEKETRKRPLLLSPTVVHSPRSPSSFSLSSSVGGTLTTATKPNAIDLLDDLLAKVDAGVEMIPSTFVKRKSTATATTSDESMGSAAKLSKLDDGGDQSSAPHRHHQGSGVEDLIDDHVVVDTPPTLSPAPHEAEQAPVVWSGKIDMVSVGMFEGTWSSFTRPSKYFMFVAKARQVGGVPVTDPSVWRALLPQGVGSGSGTGSGSGSLSVDGRISHRSVHTYLEQMVEMATTRELLIIELTPTDNILFDYFQSRSRYAVVATASPSGSSSGGGSGGGGGGSTTTVTAATSSTVPALKDMYLLPLPKGDSIPDFLYRIEHEIPIKRSRDYFLAVLVVNKSALAAKMTGDAKGVVGGGRGATDRAAATTTTTTSTKPSISSSSRSSATTTSRKPSSSRQNGTRAPATSVTAPTATATPAPGADYVSSLLSSLQGTGLLAQAAAASATTTAPTPTTIVPPSYHNQRNSTSAMPPAPTPPHGYPQQQSQHQQHQQHQHSLHTPAPHAHHLPQHQHQHQHHPQHHYQQHDHQHNHYPYQQQHPAAQRDPYHYQHDYGSSMPPPSSSSQPPYIYPSQPAASYPHVHPSRERFIGGPPPPLPHPPQHQHQHQQPHQLPQRHQPYHPPYHGGGGDRSRDPRGSRRR